MPDPGHTAAPYDWRVRRLLLLLMIVLLPLRGWAGDLMSIQMSGVGMASGMSSAMSSAMPADCPMHLQTIGAATDTESARVPPGMDNCASCELCIPMAELTGGPMGVFTFAAHAQPLMGGVDFISISPAPVLKPPIF